IPIRCRKHNNYISAVTHLNFTANLIFNNSPDVTTPHTNLRIVESQVSTLKNNNSGLIMPKFEFYSTSPVGGTFAARAYHGYNSVARRWSTTILCSGCSMPCFPTRIYRTKPTNEMSRKYITQNYIYLTMLGHIYPHCVRTALSSSRLRNMAKCRNDGISTGGRRLETKSSPKKIHMLGNSWFERCGTSKRTRTSHRAVKCKTVLNFDLIPKLQHKFVIRSFSDNTGVVFILLSVFMNVEWCEIFMLGNVYTVGHLLQVL
ncbi:hypothetical protein L9F63_008788, partial [Diploptera punctata]